MRASIRSLLAYCMPSNALRASIRSAYGFPGMHASPGNSLIGAVSTHAGRMETRNPTSTAAGCNAFRAAILWIRIPGEHAQRMAFTFRAMSSCMLSDAMHSGQPFVCQWLPGSMQ